MSLPLTSAASWRCPLRNTIAGCSDAGLRRLQETPSVVRGITHRPRAVFCEVLQATWPVAEAPAPVDNASVVGVPRC